ncbi:hypothetical protein D9611_010570 [Ephemerocybe angulata]|uniref:Uncharacterized protein n=1 Tax=Ephemerocybe angulata TaxID=980116 RepID=A0A8H5BVR2_9AGAR|nr:hypothetical protein D9611_010570 [Tulosesus angulatus]
MKKELRAAVEDPGTRHTGFAAVYGMQIERASGLGSSRLRTGRRRPRASREITTSDPIGHFPRSIKPFPSSTQPTRDQTPNLAQAVREPGQKAKQSLEAPESSCDFPMPHITPIDAHSPRRSTPLARQIAHIAHASIPAVSLLDAINASLDARPRLLSTPPSRTLPPFPLQDLNCARVPTDLAASWHSQACSQTQAVKFKEPSDALPNRKPATPNIQDDYFYELGAATN